MTGQIIYRDWVIDRYRKPDWCFYAYAPSYDGLAPRDTQCAATLHELCDQIDEEVAARGIEAFGQDAKRLDGEATKARPRSGAPKE